MFFYTNFPIWNIKWKILNILNIFKIYLTKKERELVGGSCDCNKIYNYSFLSVKYEYLNLVIKIY